MAYGLAIFQSSEIFSEAELSGSCRRIAVLPRNEQGKKKKYTGTSPPHFSKKGHAMGKKWPVQMNSPFFAVEAYVPGGSRIRPKKKRKNAFRPVPVQTFTFPAEWEIHVWAISSPEFKQLIHAHQHHDISRAEREVHRCYGLHRLIFSQHHAMRPELFTQISQKHFFCVADVRALGILIPDQSYVGLTPEYCGKRPPEQ